MIVVKLGGATGNDPGPVLDDLADLHQEAILVHGASGAADDLQRRLGGEPRHVTSPSGHRYRVTDEEALEALVMAAARMNRDLVAGLRARDVDAVGLSAMDAGLLARRKRAVQARVGDRTIVVRDRSGVIEDVRPIPLAALLDAGQFPVVTLPAAAADGQLLNVDADRIAAVLAAELGAGTLVLLSNVPGVLADPDDPDSLIGDLPAGDLDRVLDDVARGRFKRKILAAREALQGGVERVVIGDSRRKAPIRAARDGEGTVIR